MNVSVYLSMNCNCAATKLQNQLETPHKYSSVYDQSPDNQYSFKNRCERLKLVTRLRTQFWRLEPHEATTNAVNSAIEKDEQLHRRKIFLLLVWYVQFCLFQVIVSLHSVSRLLESFIPLAVYLFFLATTKNSQKQFMNKFPGSFSVVIDH